MRHSLRMPNSRFCSCATSEPPSRSAPMPSLPPVPTVDAFLAAARRAVDGLTPQDAMRALLDATVRSLHAARRRWIEHDDDELLLTSSPRLTVYHITLSPRIQYPPHDLLVPAQRQRAGPHRAARSRSTLRGRPAGRRDSLGRQHG